MDESAGGEGHDETGTISGVMSYILNPWPFLAVGITVTIVAAKGLIGNLIGNHQRKRDRAKSTNRRRGWQKDKLVRGNPSSQVLTCSQALTWPRIPSRTFRVITALNWRSR